ncbi:MAG: EAL domain-containing protein [Micromonosporaceae bacterium]|nr:EAL domain-containing protein [Micromonosporaceae bacterium]
MYAPLSSLARGSLPRRGSAPRFAVATLGRTVLLAMPVLFLLAGPPCLFTRGDTPTSSDDSRLDTELAGSLTVDGAGLITPRLAPAVSWLAAAVVVIAFYLGHRVYRDGQRRPVRLAGGDESSWSRTCYALAVGLVGLAALMVAVGGWFGVPEPALATAVNLTAIASGTGFLAALLSMPAALGAWARLRLLADGVVVGLCLTFCAWTLLVAPQEPADLPVLSIVFCCCVLATALVSAANPWLSGHRPVLGAAGAGVAMAGLLGLSLVLAHPVSGWWLAAVIALLLTAPVLGWCGFGGLALGEDSSGPASVTSSPRRSSAPSPDRTSPDHTSSGRTTPGGTLAAAGLGDDPAAWVGRNVIAWPSALALAVTVHQLATGAHIDRASAVLGTLAVVGVGVRYLLISLAPSPRSITSGGTEGAGGFDGVEGGADWSEGIDGAVSAVPRPRAGDRATRPPVHTDPLTGLADPTRLAWSIAAMRSAPRSPGALLLIGIDGLDTVPDTCRDDLVREVATRLRRFVASDEGDRTSLANLPARWSAAELALLTPANLAQAYGLAHRVLTLLVEPVAVPSGTPQLSVCVGVTDLAGASSTEDVVRRARVALRRARQLGPGRVEWYDPAVAEVVARREVLERDLPEAMRRGELDLIYQPILDLEHGRPLAVEALLRWRHPRFGTLLPADVIPIAEETGAIVEVDRWALWRALVRLAIWRQEDRDLAMAINVSPRTLATSMFAEEVAAALGAYDLPPNRLVVEVAEAEIEDSTAVDEGVAALREIGVRTALDAFGTGVASLTHLRRLPIDMVKIGKPFFEKPAGSGTGSNSETLMIDLMVGVGRRLGVDVVAQGVEAPAHLTVVRNAGCRMVQGHLFARPLPAEQTEAYLDGFLVRS